MERRPSGAKRFQMRIDRGSRLEPCWSCGDTCGSAGKACKCGFGAATLRVVSSFTCQYLDLANDLCLLLKTDCVPGRRGCVLRDTSTFLIPAEERLRLLEEEKKAAALSKVAAKNKRRCTQR
jgi:hypothetical protein